MLNIEVQKLTATEHVAFLSHIKLVSCVFIKISHCTEIILYFD